VTAASAADSAAREVGDRQHAPRDTLHVVELARRQPIAPHRKQVQRLLGLSELEQIASALLRVLLPFRAARPS